MSANLAPGREFARSPKNDKRNDSLSDRVRPYLEKFAKAAAATEGARMVSPESIAMLRDAGMFRSLVPKAYGGDECSLLEFCRAIRLIAASCPSTAWVSGVLAVHPAGVSHFAIKAQEAFWSTGADTIASSSGAPIVKATLADGGLRVTGRGRWSSGCDHASWAMVGIKAPDVTNKRYAEERYTDYMALIPRSDYTIDDTWYSTGLRGTGSKDLVLNDVFIPYERLEVLGSLMLGYAHGEGLHDSWIVRTPFPILFGIFLPAVALGCADGMIEQFVKRQRVRKNAYTGGQGILSVPALMRLAESVHEHAANGLYFEQQLRDLESHGQEGRSLTEDSYFSLQSKLPYTTRVAVRVIDRLFEAAGASAMADFNPMQRFWRDAHTAALHQGSDYDLALQMHGRNLMGLMPDPNL